MRGDVGVPTNPTATDNVACQLRINSPLILHPNAPVSFSFPSLHSSASPPSPPSQSTLLKKKNSQKKLSATFSSHSSAFNVHRLSLLSHSSYYHFFRFSSSRTSSVTYLITLLLQSFAFVMGDNATEIDLDSVIDRLLEGAFLFLGSRNIIYGSGAVDSPYLQYSWWSSVHVGWHIHGRCPRYAERPPV